MSISQTRRHTQALPECETHGGFPFREATLRACRDPDSSQQSRKAG